MNALSANIGDDISVCTLQELTETSGDTPSHSQPLPRRTRRTLEDFLCALAAIFRRKLGGDIELRLSEENETDVCENGWQLLMQFRIFQRNLWICLPSEFVEQLTALQLKRPRSLLLAQPSKEEVTALCYLFASMLAEEPMFTAQQIYLASVGNGELEPAGDRTRLFIAASIDSGEYILQFVSDPQLLERISAFSRCAPGGDAYYAATSKINCAEFQLSLRFAVKSPLELLAIEPGSSIAISSPVWSLIPTRSVGSAPEIRLNEIGSTESELRFQCERYSF